MNLKEIILTLVIFYVGYQAMIYKYPKSIFYSFFHGTQIVSTSLPRISQNNSIQQAYEVCSSRFEADFKSDNRHLPRDIFKMLKDEMPDVCKAEISGSCKRGINNPFCQNVLKQYGQ